MEQNQILWSQTIRKLRKSSFVANHCNGYELY